MSRESDRLHRRLFEATAENEIILSPTHAQRDATRSGRIAATSPSAMTVRSIGPGGGEPSRRVMHPSFVLANHPRVSLMMKWGRFSAFCDRRHRLGLRSGDCRRYGRERRHRGGIRVVRHHLKAGMVDKLRLHISLVLLGTR